MRILFCPLASHGFVYPMIGMARRMAERGHSTAFATDESFAEELARHGCERIPRGPARDGASFGVATWSEAYWAAIQVKHLEHALERFQPDLVVGQPLTLGVLLAAERAALPIALLGFCTYQWPRSRRALADPATEHERRLAWRLREWTALYNDVRRLFKLPPLSVDALDTPALGDLFLLRNVPGPGIGDDDLPPQVALVGDCLWEPPVGDPELESWLRRAEGSGKPVVYLQHGRFFSYPDFWSSWKAVARSRELWVAVSTSRMDCEVGELPPHCLARPFLPQNQILRYADLLVTAGNTTAVLGAATAGVPVLLMPGGGEQPDVAAWCEQAGMAKVLSPPAAVTSEKILAGVEEVLAGSSYRLCAGRMRRRFARHRGFDRAVSALEGLVERPARGSSRCHPRPPAEVIRGPQS